MCVCRAVGHACNGVADLRNREGPRVDVYANFLELLGHTRTHHKYPHAQHGMERREVRQQHLLAAPCIPHPSQPPHTRTQKKHAEQI